MHSQTPLGYHYSGQPTKSVDRVRQVVYNNFAIGQQLLELALAKLVVY